MGEILIVRIFPCDGSTCKQTVKLLFSGHCIANGNASACGGINGHFAFDGDSGRGFFFFFFRILRVVLINAAAADGRAAGKSIIRSLAALCGDAGGTGFGALDGDLISVSVIVRFGFCAAADAGCTNTALCILDGDLSFNGHIAKAARAAADACAAIAALCIFDLCVAFDGHVTSAKSTAADASTSVAAGRALDGGASFNPHSRAAIDTAADACAAIAALCIFDRCVILDGYSAGTPPTTAANTGRLFAASNSFNRCIAGNCHIAFTGVTAADAGTSAAAGRFFNNSAASNGHSCCITARTTAADACSANNMRSPPRVCSANGIDRSSGNGNVGITARTATADTGAIEAARRGNAATGDLDFTGVLHISAANARTAETARGS